MTKEIFPIHGNGSIRAQDAEAYLIAAISAYLPRHAPYTIEGGLLPFRDLIAALRADESAKQAATIEALQKKNAELVAACEHSLKYFEAQLKWSDPEDPDEAALEACVELRATIERNRA